MVQKNPAVQLSLENPNRELRIVRHKQVRNKLQVSSAKLFDMVAKGVFPKPFTLIPGGRAVGWLEHEVDAWILDRQATSGREVA